MGYSFPEEHLLAKSVARGPQLGCSFLDGQHLLIFLKHFGWNTIDISKELGLSQPTISRIASGKQHPTRETYDKILALVEKECARVKEMRIRLISLTKDFA